MELEEECELEEEIELDEDLLELWTRMYYCRGCTMFDCSMEELKNNRVVLDK